MIFHAFNGDSVLSKKDIETKLNEPWTFLKPIMEDICEFEGRTENGRQWRLKPEYRLHSDFNKNNQNNDGSQPPATKKQRI